MTVHAAHGSEVEVAGVTVEISTRGNGKPLLVLHPGHPAGPLPPENAALEALAKTRRVIAPLHPGFGARPAPRSFTTIDDLAYLYLDLLDTLDLSGVAVVGLQLGGFIAAEMAVKSCARIAQLVLVDSFGIKVGNRETRDIADIYAMTDKQLAELSFADAANAPNPRTLPESTLLTMARSRESTARYAWSPYMHDPKLKDRLHRVSAPALVLWGAEDRVAAPDYGRSLAATIPDARFALIDGAGSFPHLEQPEALAKAITDFIG